MAFFEQEIANAGAYLPNGHKIECDFILDTGQGFLATNIGYVVQQIRQAVAARNGGWLEISEDGYNEAVKKKAEPPSKQRLRKLNAGMLQADQESRAALAAAVAAKPEPVKPPTADQMKIPSRPRLGKVSALDA